MRIRLVILFLLCFIQASVNAQDAVKTSQIADKLYRISIGSTNVVALIDDNSVLLSDCAYNTTASLLKSSLEKLGGDEIKIIINTHWHFDHTSGNTELGKDALIISQSGTRDILLHDQEIMGNIRKALPEQALPDLTIDKELELYFGDEHIILRHMPNGHTSGDLVVYFENSGVLHIGDLIFSDIFPYIDISRGGNVQQLSKNLESIAYTYPDTIKIIVGHGRDYSMKDLVDYNKMLKETMAVVKAGKEQGLSLDELQNRKVLDKWDMKWGRDFIPTENWIEYVYESIH